LKLKVQGYSSSEQVISELRGVPCHTRLLSSVRPTYQE